ncbi:MAG TPA: hypothetical protein VFX43_15825 [Chitinophagaceae bacterium]|jgi:hypothetical protein|nr:hypothetical protein [Chitinophagaceae bacterium]
MQITYLKEQTEHPADQLHFNPVWRGLSHVLSVIFHPLFVPLVGTWLIIVTHPFQFAAFGGNDLFRLYASVITNAVILTGFTVLVLKLVKFIQSIRLHTQRDRIIPYVATMTFYFWTFLVFRHQTKIPLELTAFLLGNFLAVVFAFVSNLFLKISMHTLGMGGLLGLMLCSVGDRYFNISLPLMAIILLCGVVSTSRLILGEHTPREVYWGMFFGVIAQLIAFWVII